MKRIKYLSTFLASLWVLDGLIIVYSTINSTGDVLRNFIAGAIFILIGWYFYKKEKYFLEFLEGKSEEKNFLKVIRGEVIFLILASLLGLIAFMGVYSRTFIEGYAVFG